jgi:hypothetical protein
MSLSIAIFAINCLQTMQRFRGVYHASKKYTRRPYVIEEIGTLRIESQDNTKGKLIVGGEEILKTGHRLKKDDETWNVDLNNPNCKWHFRLDGSLVFEGEQRGLFGQVTQHAQVFTLIGHKLVRRVYMDYWFRGPFGGFWPWPSYIYIWTRSEQRNHSK